MQIFEKILKLLIFTKIKINRNIVQILRLVQKHWLNTTSTLLKRSTLPIIVIKTDIAKNLTNEKPFNAVVKTLTSPTRLSSSLLPFKLILTKKYFHQKSDKSLLKCLTRLGNELLEIQVSFPKDGGAMPLELPQLHLPQLRKISFGFSHLDRTYVFPRPPANIKNGLLLFQQILNASENLRDFVFPFDGYNCTLDFPENAEGLQLPDSILSVEIQNRLETEHMKILLRNQLPNLNHLTFKMPTNPSENEMMFKLLERFQHSLKSLDVDGEHNSSNEKMILKFPHLEKLDKIQIHGAQYELEPERMVDLQKLFPNVSSVVFNRHTEATLSNWIQRSKFGLVRSLSLSVVGIDLKINEDLFKSVSLEMMAKLHTVFPNVSKMEITVSYKDMNGLLYLFENMQLKSLRINVREDVRQHRNWKSILIGLPAWLISAHSEESDYFQSYIRKRGRKPCLLNLTGKPMKSLKV